MERRVQPTGGHALLHKWVEIYRLLEWDSASFAGRRGELPFAATDIEDLWLV
jgi:hypothetical protein